MSTRYPEAVTQPPSLSDALFSAIGLSDGLPGVIAEGVVLNNATIGTLLTPAHLVRRYIVNDYLNNFPINSGSMMQQVTGPGAVTFTPDAVDFPGTWNQHVYGVLVEVDMNTNASKTGIQLTVAGFTDFEDALSLTAVASPPVPINGGGARARFWIFPGVSYGGGFVYMPFSFRPALGGAGDPLVNAHNITVTAAAGLAATAVVTARLLTRGDADVDTLVATVAAKDHRAIASAYAR